MSKRKTWQPKVEAEPEFHPFAGIDRAKDDLVRSPRIRDASEDTAPLEGTKDLSDTDSLTDVIAAQYAPESQSGSPPESTPESSPGSSSETPAARK